MKTLRLMMSALSILAVTACGASDVNDVPSDDAAYEPTPDPESTPEATPVPTEIPNVRPDVPLFTLSATSVKPQEEVRIDLALHDPDGDAMTTDCIAALTSQVPEFPVDGLLTKISETQWTFLAPITEAEIGLAVIRCEVSDARGGVSDLAESMAIEIDNHVEVPDEPRTERNICNFAKLGCKLQFDADNLAMHVRIPDPQIYIPDQVRGMFVDLPHTDFVVSVNVDVNMSVARYSILDSNVPSIQVTVGADQFGSGYSLELLPYAVSGSTFSTLKMQWRWQVRALAADGMTKENLFGGNVLASGNLGGNAPTHVDARVQDGLLQFAINGSIFTPAIAATNAAGSQVGFSARAAEVEFSDAYAILKP